MGTHSSVIYKSANSNLLNTSGIYDEEFYLDEIKKIHFSKAQDVEYYWIDPKVYNGQNQKYYKTLQDNFQIQCFTSIQSLKNDLQDMDDENAKQVKIISAASLNDEDYKYLQNQSKISHVILFCQNQERAKLLMANFPKIKTAGYTILNLIKQLKKLQNQSSTAAHMTNALFMMQDDTNLINKYRLNYSCFIKPFNKDKAKKDFVQLSIHLFPDQKAKISEFAKTYDVNLKQQQNEKQVINWAFKDSFFWKMVQIFPKTNVDPKKLGYLRLPFKDLYLSIYQKHKLDKNKPQTCYIVIQLNEAQKNKLAQSHQNFLIFTSFLKGYTQEAQAMKQFKARGQNKNTFLFDIVFSKKKYDNDLDFGYIIDESLKQRNVIFNIYNFFRLDQINIKQRRGILVYGALAELYFKRNDPITRNKITQKQQCLLRNFDFAEDLSKKVSDQANLLQMSGSIRQSINIYSKKIEQIRKTNVSQLVLDQYALRIGDAYKMGDEFYKAQKQYLSIESSTYKVVALVHLAQLYFAMNKFQKVQQIVKDLQPKIIFLKQNGFIQESFKAQNYYCMWLMRQNKFKQASKRYKLLQAETATYYDYKFEGIPLVHDIFRNMAMCQSRLNNHSQALNMLSTTKGWQKICEGTTANLAITQKMIQDVYMSKGDQKKADQSKKIISQMKLKNPIIMKDQENYLHKTKVLPNLNKSMVEIDL